MESLVPPPPKKNLIAWHLQTFCVALSNEGGCKCFNHFRSGLTIDTEVRVDINELVLRDAEQLGFRGQKENPSYANVVVKKEMNIHEDLEVRNNFTMHFSRCTTLTPGGKFNIAFTGTKT